ncbi:MAG: hypothetical protein Q9163_003002 [Psora crenata]
MGSLTQEPDGELKEWNILVTGFGPFLDNYINPSFLIANTLPATYQLPNLPQIVIHTYPHPIEVSYQAVRTLIPRLLFPKPHSAFPAPASSGSSQNDVRTSTKTNAAKEKPNYDIVLNIGLAPGRKYYSFETCAHRDEYVKRDIYFRDMKDDTYWRDEYDAPELLKPSFDMADVWRRWKQSLLRNEHQREDEQHEQHDVDEEDVRPSSNAGRYICEFTFFTTLLEFWRRRQEARGAFLHVPCGIGETDLRRGRRVVLALMAALVGSEIAKSKKLQKGEGEGEGEGLDSLKQRHLAVVMDEDDGAW